MNDDLIVKQLKIFLAAQKCPWCGNSMVKHNGEELIKCLWAYLFTREGIEKWRLEVGDF